MKKVIIVTLFCFAIGIGGCKLLEITSDTQGKSHTQLTDTINTVAKGVETVSGFVPGYGMIGAGVSMLLSLISNGLLAFANRKKGTVVDTVISGVEQARSGYKELLDNIVNVVKLANPETGVKVQAMVDKVVNIEQKIDPIVSNISSLAKVTGVSSWLDSRVQQVTKGV